ncbi:MAG: hypothetical protein ABIK07_19910 [Planctomycetota bacterium]
MKAKNPKDQTEAQKRVEISMVDELNRLIGENIRQVGINLLEPTCEICLPNVADLEISESGAVELNISIWAEFSSLNEFYASFESEQTSNEKGNPSGQGFRQSRIRELIEGIRELNSTNVSNGKTKINFGQSHVRELIAFFENVEFSHESE